MPKPKLPPLPQINFEDVASSNPEVFVALFREPDGSPRFEANTADPLELLGFLKLAEVHLLRYLLLEGSDENER